MTKFSALTAISTAIALSFSAATVSADPIRIQADFTCPIVDMVANFGTYIAGVGMEELLDNHNPVYFKSNDYVGMDVSSDLSNYFNNGAFYDSTTGIVTCSYSSQIHGDPSFDLDYYITNGYGGRIREQTANTIYIIFPFGLHP